MPRQLAIDWEAPKSKRGGARDGAGRKRTAPGLTKGVPHRERSKHASRYPIHVTLRAVPGIASLRNIAVLRVLYRHIASACARGRRIVHFSLEDNHLHLIIEAADCESISRTIQGVASILARGFNRALGRRGQLWLERYHRHDLRTPTEVHRAIGYVLQNFRKHAGDALELAQRMSGLDPYSSAAWFDGWDDEGTRAAALLAERLERNGLARCTAAPRTFLLSSGFRLISTIAFDHVPPRSLRARFVSA